MEQFYNNMENNSLKIIHSINQNKQSDKLAGIVLKLCEKIADFTATEISHIRSIGKTHTPVYLVNKIASFGRLINNALNYYTGNGKEEFINHCVKWCNITQGQLERCITDVYMHQYNHLDIRISIYKLSHFIDVIGKLFSKLAELEDISDKPNEPRIVVPDGEINNKRRSFLRF